MSSPQACCDVIEFAVTTRDAADNNWRDSGHRRNELKQTNKATEGMRFLPETQGKITQHDAQISYKF